MPDLDALRRIAALAARPDLTAGRALYACVRTLEIRRVPFEQPCLILVLAGRKVIYAPEGAVTAAAGELLAVPAPAGLDLRNEPEPRRGDYRALVIPFRTDHLDRLQRLHGLPVPTAAHLGVLHLRLDGILDAVHHYLESPGPPRLVEHRLLELLLLIAEADPRLLAFPLAAAQWRGRVLAVLAADLAHEWSCAEVAGRLAMSESGLRRRLHDEGTGFRTLLQGARLGAALERLQQSALPVQRIACDCGYRSLSRFSANFRERFGLSPTELRASMSNPDSA